MRFRETLRALRSIQRASRGVRAGRSRLKLEALEDRTLLASNPIVAENMLPGSSVSEWDISGVGDTSLQGFATEISVDHGQTISFKIDDRSRAS